ncbi:glycosyltransferase involved in cell wall biosynthesis [Gillisia mitskevichiae]|uniref:Glycosyltransferase involved in cell wall biosynthesis n=1 Tax=Gillisia mitskevichiae TaxID=270921 RepID=A0A495PYH5_9FLAO|nr:glycosyltransferase [Gillisia mitskevichiae]RKS53949.1 glycosyltransferase involved in cell wall biosynthesis [Gillisia mitskevichiae]
MNIVFICGTLEPGRDGVGDYTRRLAAELRTQHLNTAILSLNDKYIDEYSESIQEFKGVEIPVLRLGEKLATYRKTILAKNWIEKQNPEWLSLQYVPYSFQQKGIPWNLAYQLHFFSKGRKWQIMFHELWIDSTNYKNTIIASLQRFFIKDLARKLNPNVIHTSLPLYKKRLKYLGFSAKELPIFSNILENNGSLHGYSPNFNIVFFSQFKVRESVIEFMKKLVKELILADIDFRILLVGGCHEERVRLVNELRKIPRVNRRIIYKGFLNEIALKKTIQSSDLCITPVPQHVLGKSGSAAAFLAQGIPVAAPYIKAGYEEFGIGFYDERLKNAILRSPNLRHLDIAREAAKEAPAILNISKIANQYLADILEESSVKFSGYPIKLEQE